MSPTPPGTPGCPWEPQKLLRSTPDTPNLPAPLTPGHIQSGPQHARPCSSPALSRPPGPPSVLPKAPRPRPGHPWAQSGTFVGPDVWQPPAWVLVSPRGRPVSGCPRGLAGSLVLTACAPQGNSGCTGGPEEPQAGATLATTTAGTSPSAEGLQGPPRVPCPLGQDGALRRAPHTPCAQGGTESLWGARGTPACPSGCRVLRDAPAKPVCA